MDANQFQYHLAEYQALKNELAQTFRNAYQVVFVSVASNAAIVSFLSTSTNPKTSSAIGLAIYLPVFLAAVSLFLFEMRRRTVDKITSYLYVLEDLLAFKSLGWERHYEKDIKARPFFVRTPFILRVVMWTQVAYTAAFPVLHGTGGAR